LKYNDKITLYIGALTQNEKDFFFDNKYETSEVLLMRAIKFYVKYNAVNVKCEGCEAFKAQTVKEKTVVVKNKKIKKQQTDKQQTNKPQINTRTVTEQQTTGQKITTEPTNENVLKKFISVTDTPIVLDTQPIKENGIKNTPAVNDEPAKKPNQQQIDKILRFAGLIN